MNDARLCRPWLRINRVLRAMLETHWSTESYLTRPLFRQIVARIDRLAWHPT